MGPAPGQGAQYRAKSGADTCLVGVCAALVTEQLDMGSGEGYHTQATSPWVC